MLERVLAERWNCLNQIPKWLVDSSSLLLNIFSLIRKFATSSLRWTWFDANGNKLSDEQVSTMTLEDKKQAFLEGRYTSSSNSNGSMNIPSNGEGPSSQEFPPDLNGEGPENMDEMREPPDKNSAPSGGPQKDTTQSTGTGTDSEEYESFSEMLAEYESDIEEINQGDEYGNNIVDLYNPMDYVTKKANETDHPVWMKMIMGAQERDISLFNSMNLALALSAQGVNTDLDWQWNGGHVPSEIFGDSFSLTVDTMYGEYVSGAVKINKSKDKVSQNGESEQAEGENISSWVQTSNSDVTVNTKELINYRTENAMKAVPGFDVIDYGQEDYVFGSSDKDARHWDETVLEILKENQDELSSLFNQNNN